MKDHWGDFLASIDAYMDALNQQKLLLEEALGIWSSIPHIGNTDFGFEEKI